MNCKIAFLIICAIKFLRVVFIRLTRLLGQQSQWFGYLQSLPSKHELSIALFWGSGSDKEDSDEVHAVQWFKGTEVEQLFIHSTDPGALIVVRCMAVPLVRTVLIFLLNEQREIQYFYHNVVSPLLLSRGMSQTTLGDFQYVYALVSSRAFIVDAFHGLAMVPIADA